MKTTICGVYGFHRIWLNQATICCDVFSAFSIPTISADLIHVNQPAYKIHIAGRYVAKINCTNTVRHIVTGQRIKATKHHYWD